jgi:hypothetical protein
MNIHALVSLILYIFIPVHHVQPRIISPLAKSAVSVRTVVLASHTFSLADRYPNPGVNTVFANNILLDLYYLSGKIKQGEPINWQFIKKPNTFDVILKPGEVFAFHNSILPQFHNDKILSTPVLFGGQDGFLSDGYLFGDGVCHLASIINWTARDAGLSVLAPTKHNFANIPDVPKQYGVSIYTDGTDDATSMLQNLYIQNNKRKKIFFVFKYFHNTLNVKAIEG